MSKFTALKKLIGAIDSPEKAAKLVGSERKAYLNALDELYGPQQARAKSMGFDTTETLYHGTPASSIDEFGQGSEGLFGSGSYFTDNPHLASTYADTGTEKLSKLNLDEARQAKDFPGYQAKPYADTVYPVHVKKGNTINMDEPANSEIWKQADIQVIPGETNADVYHRVRGELYPSGEYHPTEVAEGMNELIRDVGIDTIEHQGGLRAGKGSGVIHDVRIDVDPSETANIRSTNAAFDPRFKDSPKIMAGAMAAPAMQEDPSMFQQAQDTVLSGLASAVNSPTAQGAMDLMSIPGALGRSTINAVTENRAPTQDELYKAMAFPTGPEQDQLATSATERIIPDAKNVKSRTALDTLLKFM